MSGVNSKAFFGSHFMAGQTAGMCGYVVAYPFDFVKNYIQAETEPKKAAKLRSMSAIAVAKQIVREQGLKALYRGFWSPFFMFGITSSVYFGVNFNLRAHMEARNNGEPLSLGQLALCGAAAGFAATPLITLTDRAKTWTVNNPKCPEASQGLYGSAKYLVRNYGVRRGLLYGWQATVYREVPQVAIYYSLYEALTHRYIQKQGGWERDTLPSWVPLITGAVTAGVLWTMTLWLDRVKTVIMSEPPNTYSSWGDALKQCYKTGGVRGMNVGWQACMLRSMPFHGVVWATYSQVQVEAMKWLQDDE